MIFFMLGWLISILVSCVILVIMYILVTNYVERACTLYGVPSTRQWTKDNTFKILEICMVFLIPVINLVSVALLIYNYPSMKDRIDLIVSLQAECIKND
jgi:hypothetical protein